MTTHTTDGPAPTSGPQAATDPRPLLFAAVDQVLALADRVTVDDLRRPTPCDGYDVQLLLGHLLAVLRRVTYVAGGGHAFDVPSIVLEVPDDGWPPALHEAAGRLRETWASDDVLDRVLHLPFGDVPGRGAATAYVSETTTHAWDLAVATGQTGRLDDALAVAAFGAASRFIPDVDRGTIPFGAVVRVPDDAPAYARLAGWLGRDPGWTPPAG